MEEVLHKRFEETEKVKKRFLQENHPQLIDIIKLIADALENGSKLLLFGNGGSAAEAQHLAAEFVNRFSMDRPPLPAIALSTDSSILTSIGNDYSFSEVFSKQIVALGKEGDIAIGISTSGNSANVIRAIEVAKEMSIETIALTGNDGGDLVKVATYSLIVPSSSTPCIQEVHMAVGHILCEMVEAQIFKMAY
ncbi:MAG: D-sedoheptulose 7-phosphate isomerase [Syntrophobacterales bacterium]|nr:MAG: D-sedoheptulose 7-phosphate isomerase [Syntrophobacterales bacterium]